MAVRRFVLLALVTSSCGAFSLPKRTLRNVGSTSLNGVVPDGMPTAAGELMGLLGESTDQVSFQLTMDVVEEMYAYEDVAFSVGDVVSKPGENTGSAKIFSFAKISMLEKETTLHLFGDYYRKDVLENPDGDDHANIRAFMKGGWDCVKFPDGLALSPKPLQNTFEAFGQWGGASTWG